MDLRRPGDAPQGRDGELRARRPLGRRLGRHQRAGPRQPAGPALDGVQRRALRPLRAQAGCAGPRPCTTRSAAPSSASSTSPRPGSAPTRSGSRPPGCWPGWSSRPCRAPPSTSGPRPWRTSSSPASCSASSAPQRRASTASGCCSTAARPRSSRCSPCTPTGSRSTSLHALLYGDHAVTFSTLKAEVSHLRHALAGQARLASLPPADADRHRRRPRPRPAARGQRRCSRRRLRRRPAPRHREPGPGRDGGVRRRRRPRGPARRPPARRRPALRRVSPPTTRLSWRPACCGWAETAGPGTPPYRC
ncbi:hypothetical protein [Nocardioides convexus]|uniref:hypothetical protein n=1 Tax=Nocardioides convexus TaxID=2712224 RepID=UPI00241873D7|nr:hypothetical protein [Nocardioides convexus]